MRSKLFSKITFHFNPRIRSVELGICPIASVCTVLLSRSSDPGHANVSETFLRGHVATIPGTCLSNLKFVSLALLELLAFNSQKITGSRDSGHAPFYPVFTFRGWRPPRHVVWTMNRYNWSIDDVREAFQVSHWKCIYLLWNRGCQFGVKLGKNRGYPYWILTPNFVILTPIVNW